MDRLGERQALGHRSGGEPVRCAFDEAEEKATRRNIERCNQRPVGGDLALSRKLPVGVVSTYSGVPGIGQTGSHHGHGFQEYAPVSGVTTPVL